jgi:hypothetical protein
MKKGQGLDPHKWYPGTVVDDDDTHSGDGQMRGRVKIRVDGLFDSYPDSDLPWAIPDQSHADGASPDSGSFDVPSKGSKIKVKFQDGSPLHPIYSGYLVDDQTMLPEAKVNYPKRKVHLYKDGTLLVLDTKTKQAFIRAPGELNVYVQGNVNLYVNGNVSEVILGDKTSYIEGNLKEIVKGNYERTVLGSVTETVAGVFNLGVQGALNIVGSLLGIFGTTSAIVGSAGPLVLQGEPLIENKTAASAPPIEPGSSDQPSMPDWTGVRGSTPGNP